MTREEAISLLKQYIDYNNPSVPDFYTMEEACEVVIKALEQEPCENCCNGNQIEKAKLCQKSYLAGMEHKQEPCEDAISRQTVLDEMYKRQKDGDAITAGFIKKLPPVTPQPKMGKWTHDGSHWENRWICSECGYKLFDEQTRFCPNCGSKMQEVEE